MVHLGNFFAALKLQLPTEFIRAAVLGTYMGLGGTVISWSKLRWGIFDRLINWCIKLVYLKRHAPSNLRVTF